MPGIENKPFYVVRLDQKCRSVKVLGERGAEAHYLDKNRSLMGFLELLREQKEKLMGLIFGI